MKRQLQLLTAAVAALAAATLLPALPAAAHEGHDQAPPAAKPAAAQPRFAATSDLFEVVGIVEHDQLTLYLDRFADNAPVEGAQIEIEADGRQKAQAAAKAGGLYQVPLKALGLQPLPTTEVALTMTVTAGQQADLLTASLRHEAEGEHVHGAAAPARRFGGWPVWGGAAAATAVVVAVISAVRRRRGQR